MMDKTFQILIKFLFKRPKKKVKKKKRNMMLNHFPVIFMRVDLIIKICNGISEC